MTLVDPKIFPTKRQEMPKLDNKLNEIRHSVSMAIKCNRKRNKDLWFPNNFNKNPKTNEVYDAILLGTKSKHQKLQQLKEPHSKYNKR